MSSPHRAQSHHRKNFRQTRGCRICLALPPGRLIFLLVSYFHSFFSSASRRVLHIQLKELEQHELVKKIIYPQVPPKVEYSLTEFGKTLIPVINTLGKWGDKNERRLRKVILKRPK